MVMADTWLIDQGRLTAGLTFHFFTIQPLRVAGRKFPGWRMQRRGNGSPTRFGPGPIEKVAWKKGLVELWEVACAKDCDLASLRRLLQPACAAARQGNGELDWWAVPGHALTQQMLALGFVERPRSLCVLGKVFDSAKMLGGQLRIESTSSERRRVDIHMNDCRVEIENDAATRMALGRSTASLSHQHGLLTVYPLGKTPTAVETLDHALPAVPWAYFASEFI